MGAAIVMRRGDRCHSALVTSGTGTARPRARSCRRRPKIAPRQETSHVDDPRASAGENGLEIRGDLRTDSRAHFLGDLRLLEQAQ